MPNPIKVIQFPQPDARPTAWRFFDYWEGNRNAIDEWYQGLSVVGQQVFRSLLKNIRKTENPIHWPQLRKVVGEDRVWELRFKADGKAQRMMVTFSGERKECNLLLGCYHKGNTYTPHNAIETAVRRAKEVRAGGAKLSEREIADDL